MMAADAGVLGVKGDLRGRACPGRRCTIARITALACLLVGGASTTAVAVCPYSVGKDDRHCVLGISTDASTTFDDARVKLATLSGTRQHAEHNPRREAYSSDQISRPVCGGCKAGCTDDKDEVCSTACTATSEREDGTKRAGSPEGHGQHSVVESNQTMLDCHADDACAKGGHANAAVEAPEDQQHFGADRHADRTNHRRGRAIVGSDRVARVAVGLRVPRRHGGASLDVFSRSTQKLVFLQQSSAFHELLGTRPAGGSWLDGIFCVAGSRGGWGTLHRLQRSR